MARASKIVNRSTIVMVDAKVSSELLQTAAS